MLEIKKCDFCDSPVNLRENKEVYGKNFGQWPWIYLCSNDNCKAFISCIKGTYKPVGTLANHELRELRKQISLWLRQLVEEGPFTEIGAKDWCAAWIGVKLDEFKIAKLSVKQCQTIIYRCVMFDNWDLNKSI